MKDKIDTERRPLLGASNYSADRQGNIYGPRGKKLVQGTNGWAQYRCVTITHDEERELKSGRIGKSYNRTVHRLIWEAFHGPIPEGMEVSHLDDDKDNNALDNLALMTHKENCGHGARNARISAGLKAKKGLKKIYAEQVAARRAAKANNNGKEDK